MILNRIALYISVLIDYSYYYKGVINRVIFSHQRKYNNAWFADEIRDFPDCQILLSEIIKNTCSFGSWELIGDGIVDLALIILDINAGLGGKFFWGIH